MTCGSMSKQTQDLLHEELSARHEVAQCFIIHDAAGDGVPHGHNTRAPSAKL